MALTSTPTDYANLCTGRLAQKISPTTATGFIVTADTFKTPAGTGAATWPTGPQIWKISRKTRTTSEVEFVGVETASQSGSTVTTGTVNRYLPANGSSLTSQGDGLTFPAGSVVELVWHAYASEKVAYKDVANTFTGIQTFGTGGAVRFSGTDTSGLRLKSLTTAQRDALTPANGDFIYNSDTGVVNQYVAGAWAAVGTDATANGSTTVAGKYEEATVAEQGTATATGATGARLVPAVANLVKTSSGAGDENKIPVLNASGQLASGFINTSSLLISYPGMMMLWTTDTAPTGWILCYGQAISRSTYSDLFSVISTTYGTGDGSTTFNVPDLRGRFPLGQDDMGGSSANRVIDTDADTLGGADGDETKDISHTHTVSLATGITNPGGGSNFLATTSNPSTSTSGSATQDIMPPFITLNYIIKF